MTYFFWAWYVHTKLRQVEQESK